MTNKIQTKDIPDEALIDLIRTLKGVPVAYLEHDGVLKVYKSEHVMLSNICDLWSSVPPKIIISKLSNLIKKGLIEGCVCGCRGDFEVVEKPKINIMITYENEKRCVCR